MTNLFQVNEAEIVAKSLKSIEDVENYYKPHKEREQSFYKRQADFWKKTIPMKVRLLNDILYLYLLNEYIK